MGCHQKMGETCCREKCVFLAELNTELCLLCANYFCLMEAKEIICVRWLHCLTNWQHGHVKTDGKQMLSGGSVAAGRQGKHGGS